MYRAGPNHRPTIVGLGEVLWDLLPEGKQFGGAPANFAYHAKAMGADAHVVSAVGDDELGREILGRLDRLGLGRDCVAVDAEHPTGTVSVALDEHGKPDFTIHTGVAWDFIPDMPGLVELAGRTDAVCFGSLAQRSDVSRATIRRFLDATGDGCLRVFDINLRQHYFNAEVIAESLGRADVLKLNDDELPVVAELLSLPADEGRFMDAVLRQHELTLVALTKGANGSVLRSRDGTSAVPGTRVNVADTVGAGDAFTAAVVMGLLAGRELDAIHNRANDVAAYVCTRPGATPDLPEHLVRF